MKTIGHRGAAGVELENSLASLRAALASGVDAVEFDIWKTADNHFVLCHDADLVHMSGDRLLISDTPLIELQNIKLTNGERLATLQEALQLVTNKPVVIDVKGHNWALALAHELKRMLANQVIVISFDHHELIKFKRLMPELEVYTIGGKTALQAAYRAHKYRLTGMDINANVMNPLFYWYARIHRLKIITYTVNNKLRARVFRSLFPRIAITTDFPDNMPR